MVDNRLKLSYFLDWQVLCKEFAIQMVEYFKYVRNELQFSTKHHNTNIFVNVIEGSTQRLQTRKKIT